MTDFAAIDFETANYERTSICSVGVVIVRNGGIAEKIHKLIRPKPDYYIFTCIHGITKADTKDSPLFPDIWAEIAPKIAGLPLVAHNAPFDEGCLKAAHRCYGMDYPDYEFHCTCRASRRVFGGDLPNHKFPTVSAHCGHGLDNHHHALADAEAAAMIAMKIL